MPDVREGVMLHGRFTGEATTTLCGAPLGYAKTADDNGLVTCPACLNVMHYREQEASGRGSLEERTVRALESIAASLAALALASPQMLVAPNAETRLVFGAGSINEVR